MVLITGSGPQTRDETLPMLSGFRPFREIADTLSRRGIAVLRLDDRGTGASSGSFAGATTVDFAADVESALAWLRTRPEIAPGRLGVVGHSEGGEIAPMVAAGDPGVKAVVMMAGPAWTGRRILEYQLGYPIRNDSALSAAERDSLLALVPARVDSLAASSAWLRFFADYDPLATARRVRAPTLILQGATDQQVSAEQARELADAMRAAGNRDVTLRVFPDVDHLFLADPVGNPARYTALPTRRVDRAVLGALADWLAEEL